MTRADYDKWEARYASGRGYGKDPVPFFVQTAVAYLPERGTALDLAGGSGRHARWLASRGLETTLFDISPSGLQLAVEAAEAAGLRLHTLVGDLDDGMPDGQWDVVLVSFVLMRPYLDQLAALVAPGGVFMMVHPTHSNLERHEKPGKSWLFADGEFTGVPGLRTEFLEEGWDARGRHEVRYVGRRV